MRLTLRTLLAYRDGVLDTKDAVLLESKLRDSLTAQQISQRIDEGMSNPRLAPIPVDAKEFGFDPNNIAEYLDDTIPVDEIPALERCCLENNALLSEVGSCHRILTKALTAPVEVPRELRDRILSMPITPSAKPGRLRILRLGKDGSTVRFDAPTLGKYEAAYPESSTVNAFENGAIAAARLSPTEPRGSGIELNEGLGHQVPEYLIGSDRSWIRSALLAGMLVFSLIVVGVMAIGPLDQLQSMWTVKNRLSEAVPPAPNRKADLRDGMESQDGIGRASAIKDANKQETPSSESTTSTNSAGSAQPEPTKNQVQTEEKDEEANSPSGVATEGSTADSGSENAVKPGDGSLVSGGVTESIDVDQRSDEAKRGSNSLDMPSIKWLPESKESSESLVIFSNPIDPDSVWQQAMPGLGITIGDVIVPPFVRTEFVNGNGLRMIVCDATQLEFNGKSPLYIPYGKLILFSTPQCREITVTTPNGSFKVRFADSNSSCAIDVHHSWNETSRDELGMLRLNTLSETQVYGIQGTVYIDWKLNEESRDLDLEVGELATATSGGNILKSEMSAAPNWFRSSSGRSIDQFALQDATKYLKKSSTKPIFDALQELAQSKRAETASFAVRILCQLGRFESLFGSSGFLGRKGAYTHLQVWLPEFPNLIGSEESKGTFREAVSKGLENRASNVLRLLVIQSPTQLKDGGERFLVESLSSSQQDERLLAIIQLNSLTGKTLGFHPEKNSPESVSQWRKLLLKEDSRPTQSN